MKYYGYIYLTTDHTNGFIYIGQKHGTFDPKYLGSGRRLWNAINSHGKENFSVIPIHYIYTQKQNMLDYWEKYFIKEFKSRDRNIGYNLDKGGEGRSGFRQTEQTKRKLSLAKIGKKLNLNDAQRFLLKIRMAGENNPNYGNYWSEEQKKNLAAKQIGKKMSENAKLKMSLSHIGENNSFYGKTHTEQVRKKMVDAWKIRRLKSVSDKTRKKLSDAGKKRFSNPNELKKASERSRKVWSNALYKEKMVKTFKEREIYKNFYNNEK